MGVLLPTPSNVRGFINHSLYYLVTYPQIFQIPYKIESPDLTMFILSAAS